MANSELFKDSPAITIAYVLLSHRVKHDVIQWNFSHCEEKWENIKEEHRLLTQTLQQNQLTPGRLWKTVSHLPRTNIVHSGK